MNQSVKDLVGELKGPIVVFGAGGFIGANIVRILMETRRDVVAITHEAYIPWRLLSFEEHVEKCDVRSQEQVNALFRRHSFKTVFFFAAYGAYARQQNEDAIYQTNFTGLLNVITASMQEGLSAIVHAGSSSEYGTNCSAPAESGTLEPNSHYAVSKVAASYLIRYFGKIKQVPIVNLRLYSVYGPWEEDDRLIPRLIDAAHNGGFPPLVNKEISRDFVYVEDAIKASLLSAIRIETCKGLSLNIGTGVKTTIETLAKTAGEVFGISAEPRWGSMQNRGWDLSEWYANPVLASTLINWKAETELCEGLRKTSEWRKKQLLLPNVESLSRIQDKKRISAVVACYKDGEAMPYMHKRLQETFRKLKVDYEIIFVNDCSPDNTHEVLLEIAVRDSRVIGVEHSRNFGSQSAFLSGMSIATGDAVVLLDGDLQDPPELIEKFYLHWIAGYEVVYGQRVKREAPFFLQIAYKAFYRIFRTLANILVPVDAGDFSLIDKKVVQALLAMPERDVFLRGLRAWAGFKQIGVEYIRPERMFGVSTNNWRKNFWWARKAIFSFSDKPLEAMIFFGILLMGTSVLAIIGQIVGHFVDPSIPRGISSVLVMTLFFGSVNVLCFSILGQYIGKILEEAKGRPRFIQRSIVANGRVLESQQEIEEYRSSRRFL